MTSPSDASWPAVSVVMPVLDEERHLRAAVQHVLAQDYPGDVELVLALGPSRDETDRIAAELVREDARVRTVPNPSGSTPAALNAAIAASRHDPIVRVDGHALFPVDYLRTVVDVLRESEADNVGGVMAAEGVTHFERAVACAMTSVFGVGNARFHTGGEAGPVDSVYLGAFRRAALDRVGGYDESYVRAQDWEMNLRIRRSGGTVWFTPRLRVTYRPRGSLRALAKQYRDYGRWRRLVMRRHEGTVNLRYLAPPLALTGVVVGTVAGLAGVTVGWLLPAGYLAAVVVASLASLRGLSARSAAWLPVVFATMHGSWAVGFLTSPRDLVDDQVEEPVP